MMSQKFHDLCAAQIERLGGAFPDFRFTKPGAVQELAAWLAGRANGDQKKAVKFITSITELSVMPTISEMNRLWHQMFGVLEEQKHVAKPDCPFCTGTGWEEREFVVKSGPFAGQSATGATRCRCGGMPPTPRADQGVAL